MTLMVGVKQSIVSFTCCLIKYVVFFDLCYVTSAPQWDSNTEEDSFLPASNHFGPGLSEYT